MVQVQRLLVLQTEVMKCFEVKVNDLYNYRVYMYTVLCLLPDNMDYNL